MLVRAPAADEGESPMAISVTKDFTAPYSAVESYFYDRVIADAVTDLCAERVGEQLDAIPRGGRLLEVGCGGGQLAAWIAGKRTDIRITGLDLSAEQIARAKQRTAEFSGRVNLVEGSALDLPFKGGEFDAVLSVASIKHWPDPKKGVSECVRVLKPGGTLYIVEVDRSCRLDEARNFIERWHLPAFMHPLQLMAFRTFVAGQSFTAAEMKEFMAGLPLKDADVAATPGLPAFVASAKKAGKARSPKRT